MTLTTQGLQPLEQIRDFVDQSAPLSFEPPDRASTYDWLTQELRRFGYARLGYAGKGLLKRYLARITRLVKQFVQTGRIVDQHGRPTRPFPRRYTAEDVRRLAEIDALHGTLSGPATRKLCERAWTVFGDARYQRLAGISNGHLYNLRHSAGYQRRPAHLVKTAPTWIQIGVRRKPRPDGQPGNLRVDLVHQGDLDGITGVCTRPEAGMFESSFGLEIRQTDHDSIQYRGYVPIDRQYARENRTRDHAAWAIACLKGSNLRIHLPDPMLNG